MHVRLVKEFGFESAHWLPSFPDGHKCRRLHGHSFRIEAAVEGPIPEGQHHLMDFWDIKAVVGPLIEQLDHRCLNEIEGLENPTSEMIAKWLWDHAKPKLPLLSRIVVRETCTARCEYEGRA